MATPQPHAPVGGGGWHGPGHTMSAAPSPAGQPHQVDEPGLQVRPMGLKVHYTFDKDAKVNCLARYPHTLHVQTIPIDETASIGIVDLRACLHAVIECSPELASQDCDYTIYAVDYSESDTPLVGQGMLSWALEALRGDVMSQQPKMVTGRVTKNLLAVFGGGNRETLEVKLKLSVSARGFRRHGHRDSMDIQRSQGIERNADHPMQRSMEQQMGQQGMDQPVEQQMDHALRQQMDRPMEMAMTPTGTSEWNSFIQSNPNFGHTGQVARVASPALSQHGMSRGMSQGPPPMASSHSFCQSPLAHNQEPFGQPAQQQALPPATQEVQRVAPIPINPGEPSNAAAASSRPSSRASNRAPRKKPPTGRPRGRPRKRPADGNTSGYEDVTEGEEVPNKKRAKPTKVDSKSAPNPFSAAAPESLRVAASTSGSLRSFRPIGASNEAASGTHLQEVPRAPTPVPEGGRFAGLPGRGPNSSKLRRESTLGQQHAAAGNCPDSRLQPLSPSQEDGRSPESVAQTPAAYSEGSMADLCSVADIGSSPPVQRATPFMRSSPPPSSPVLPPMPHAELQQHDSSFANDEMDDLFAEESLPPARTETVPTRAPQEKSKPRTVNGVPMQVFQMTDGPMGQDMVWLRSLNGAPHPGAQETPLAPHPASAPSAPHNPGQSLQQMPFQRLPQKQAQAPPPPQSFSSDAPTLPPLKQADSRPKRSRPPPKKKSKPALRALSAAPPPTPPPTTDAAEKPMSPGPAAEPARDSHQSPVPMAAEPMPGIAQHASPKSSPESVTATEADHDHSTAKQPSKKAPQRIAPQNSKPRNPRSLCRSQSAGALPLALPTVPASDPAGPSSLSHSTMVELDRANPPAPSALRRAVSSGPPAFPVAASDPIRPLTSAPQSQGQGQREASVPASDAVPPPSSPPNLRSNKNIVKKHAIKQRLEEAINNGEMPPYCSNCGAIETPTWRKTWIQDREGRPEHHEFSEKPGRVTAIDILKRDAEDRPTSYRLIKKSLGPADDKTEWKEQLLCNPCGIWLTKYRVQRPPDRWDKDFSRIGQERRKKGTGRSEIRSKKSRSKGDTVHPTSEAYLPTDALGPVEPSSPKTAPGGSSKTALAQAQSQQSQEVETRERSVNTSGGDIDRGSNVGSTHSRGTGSAKSPVELDFDEAVGSTKRLLFPSPRKDGVLKVLGEVDVNMVQISSEFQQIKGAAVFDKERIAIKAAAVAAFEDGEGAVAEHDDLEALFQSPTAARTVARPSTPPPNSTTDGPSSMFETPKRPTSSHRPITRSVSRSMRSAALNLSPGQVLLQALVHQTPSKTPRAALGIQGSVGPRRSPRNHDGAFDVFDTPISRSMSSQLFSDAALNFETDELAVEDRQLGLAVSGFVEFGNLLAGEGGTSCSPPNGDRIGEFDYSASANIWGDWASMDVDDDPMKSLEDS